jgi:hypothetical protein
MTPDPAALAACPVRFPAAPELKPLDSFILPDGRSAVLLETVLKREATTAHYIIAGRGAFLECRSVVQYVVDWSAVVTGELP